MIYITQLICLKPGQEASFHQFEAIALPIIAKYNGQLMLRIRPAEAEIIEGTIEAPYEVHLISFASAADFSNFMEDAERKQFLHLKEKAIRSSLLIKGALM